MATPVRASTSPTAAMGQLMGSALPTAGSGSAVAAAAAAFGVPVVLIEKGKMGGDCLNYGCVPSKAMLAAARHAHALRHGTQYGIDDVEPDIELVGGQHRAALRDDRFAERAVGITTAQRERSMTGSECDGVVEEDVATPLEHEGRRQPGELHPRGIELRVVEPPIAHPRLRARSKAGDARWQVQKR